MRWTCIVVVALLLVSPAFGAEVTEKSSGIVRGSIAFQFEHDPADQSLTVVKGVQQNDVLRIISGYGPTGLPIKREYFLKSRTDTRWSYDILKVKKGLSITLGERQPIDLDDDGTTDLVMEYTSLVSGKGTFTFYPPGAIATDGEAQDGSNGTTETEEEIVVEEELPPEPPEAIGVDGTEEPDSADDNGSGAAEPDLPTSPSWIPFVVALVVLAAIVAAAIAVSGKKITVTVHSHPKKGKAKREEEAEGKEKAALKEEPEYSDDSDPSILHIEPGKHELVSRSPRMRRR